MKSMKKFFCFALLMMLIVVGVSAPRQSVDASSKVKITYKNKLYSFTKKKTYVMVNGEKVKLTSAPGFLKGGAYVGPAYYLFKTSSLGVGFKQSSTHKTLTLTYNNHTLKMKNGSKKAYLDGKETKELYTAPVYAQYKSSGKSCWIVPIYSVCDRLKIKYSMGSDGVISLKGSANSSTDSSTTTVNNTSFSTGKVVLVLDAGHGGSDSGAVNSKIGLKEKNMTLGIVKAAKKYFDRDSRFQVYYTRTADTYPSLKGRYTLANNVNADIFISVHINCYKTTSTGTETEYNPARNSVTTKNGITSTALASAMQKTIVKSTGFTNRGLYKRPNLQVLKYTNMPSCLLEYGFISNKSEALTMNANLSRYGKELYYGIVSFMKKKGRIQ